MEDPNCCPNIDTCKLVNEVELIGDEAQQKNYITEYCQANKTKWESCKRLIVKNSINFCPDFVLPDTTLSIDEIIDKFDEENMND